LCRGVPRPIDDPFLAQISELNSLRQTERKSSMAKNLSQRIAGYAVRRWKACGMTGWPTVRETARALRIRQSEIEDREGDGLFFFEAYNTLPDEPLANHFVHAQTHDVDVALCAYWLPYSRGCDCGEHRSVQL
jgi:hypothetical protein